jgi:hydrogenase expression/formation protein HypD
MAISEHGIRRAVDQRLKLLSGPGCPVCVTAQEEIDAAVRLARKPNLTMVTFGDMMRVPGSDTSLERERAEGADVRVVYSPLDCVSWAQEEPGREFIFLGVGFETTAPTVAGALLKARQARLDNFSVLSMFKLIPPALAAIAGSERVHIDGFILPGHVSTIIGTRPYRFLRDRYRLPSCVVGFEELDILEGIAMLLEQVRSGPEVAIQYRRVVRPEGNVAARRVMARVFRQCDANWRGIGTIPGSGLKLRPAYERFDAARKFGVRPARPRRTACRCGDVMLGVIIPPECRLFARGCSPQAPVGPCMVSSEGACAAYFKYERA